MELLFLIIFDELFLENRQKPNAKMKSKLTRSNHRVIAGVCAGIAEWLGWDIALVRLLYFLVSVISAGFPGLLVYIVLWIIMPDNDKYGQRF